MQLGHPLCLIEIYGQTESFTIEGGIGVGKNPTSDLIAVKTEKRLSAETPAGVFELTLVHSRDSRGRTWQDKLRPQDTVVIQFGNYHGVTDPATKAGQLHTRMIGFIDTISASTVITGEGKVQRAIRVRGRDAGKLFIKGMVTYWSFLGATIVGAAEFIDLSKLNGTPDEVIRLLLEGIYQRMLQITMRVQGADINFWDLLAYRLESYGVEIPAGLDYQFTGGEGTFWHFFTKIASLPFHELWIDTRRVSEALEGDGVTAKTANAVLGRDDSAPTLFLRPTPFPYLLPPAKGEQVEVDQLPDVGNESVTLFSGVKVSSRVRMDAWNALPRHEVGQSDLTGEPFDQDMSISDEEQFNVFLVFPEYSWIGQDLYLLNVPAIVDVEKFPRYGYRPMMPHTTLLKMGQVQNEEDPMVGFYSALAWRLATWNCLNDQYLSGTKSFRLLPHVHVGERLLDRSDWQAPVEFYIESIRDVFVNNEKATTTLGLTRGVLEQELPDYPTKLLNAPLTSAVGPGVRSLYRELTEPKVPASVGGI